jgi:nicotinamidase-related amidase
MNADADWPRSPELMSREDTAVLVVDVQERLLPAIRDARRVVWNIRRLLDAARALGVSVAATEQYPRGLGPTVAELADRFDSVPEKLRFSCFGCPDIFRGFRDSGKSKILVAGIEAHVCVQQTVLDSLANGFRTYVAMDAVGSRFEVDYTAALRRMGGAGATLVSTEAAMFEWCEEAGSPEFKQISALAREVAPG